MPLESLAASLRTGVRALRRDRGFTATALVTFALCLGANVALFAVLNAVLLRPLPFPRADQLVVVYNSYPKAGVERAGCSPLYFQERHAGIAAFADSAAYQDSGETIGEPGATERIEGLNVTPTFFRLLGAAPLLGRTFADEEGTPGKNDVVILSEGLWRQKFGADPHLVGRTMRVGGGTRCTIIGVMPASFRFLSSHARLWRPLVFTAEQLKPDNRHSNNFDMIARLRPGATIAMAQAQVDALNRTAAASDPYAKLVADAGFRSVVAGLHDDFVAKTRPMVLLLQAGVLALLGIGVVNLTNLLLVRASARAKEWSIRQVLGAGAAQLGRQLFAETLMLSLAGGLLGLAVGWVALRGLDFLGADRLPHAGDFTLDPLVCAVALLAAVLVGAVLAVPVVWQATRRNLAAALSVESRGGTTSRATHRLRHALLVAQFALAFVLLAGAVLLGVSFARVTAIAPGFRPDHVLTATIPLPRTTYPKDAQKIAFVGRLAHELASVPGLVAVGYGSATPFGGGTDINAITVEGHEPGPGESLQVHYMSGVAGNFFGALGIPLREGRFLTAEDTERSSRVCVIDDTVARRYWPNGGALGGHLLNGVPKPDEKPFTVVGVVGSIKQEDLADERAKGAIYLPYGSYATREITVVLRTTLAAETATGALQRAVRRVDPDLPVTDIKPLQARIDQTLVARRSPLVLAAIFSVIALLLAGIGLYGVLAYAVAQRRREIGVRMALGAQPAQIRTQFLALGAKLVTLGAALGAAGAWWSTQGLRNLLYGVGQAQPLVFAATAALLIGIALVACLVPAMRAAAVPPVEALRSD